MQNKINQIIKSIETEASQLKRKIETDFSAISNFSSIKSNTTQVGEEEGLLRLPKILYTASALLGGGALLSKFVSLQKQKEQDYDFGKDSRFLPIGLTIASLSSAVGGFLTSRHIQAKRSSSSSFANIDFTALKNDITSESIAAVKSITNEWEEFMETNQQKMLSSINSSTLSQNQKDELSSKIFTYEVIDVNLSELMTLINTASSISEIVKNLDLFRSKLISATKNAAEKQIEKYKSLLQRLYPSIV